MRQVRILSYFIMTIELIYDNMNTALKVGPHVVLARKWGIVELHSLKCFLATRSIVCRNLLWQARKGKDHYGTPQC